MDGCRKSPSIRHVLPCRDSARARFVAIVVFPSPGSDEVTKIVCTALLMDEYGIRMLVSRFRMASDSGEFGFSVRNFIPFVRIAAMDLLNIVRVGLPSPSEALVTGIVIWGTSARVGNPDHCLKSSTEETVSFICSAKKARIAPPKIPNSAPKPRILRRWGPSGVRGVRA
jgi:hypothetical protein